MIAALEGCSIPALHRIRLLASNCYLLVDNGVNLVEAGLRGEGRSILKAMAARGVRAVVGDLAMTW